MAAKRLPPNEEDAIAERPAGPLDQRVGWGSDVVAQMLRRLDIPFIALTPGASFRGLHDSLVNHLGNERPQMILCLHEEHAVAIAQGYAKATGRALAVALHSNVGLMHASMGVFNAWCDRVPMLIIGATGPLDASNRRPWIDWVHTSQDQGALIRQYVKWDDQPGSVTAMPEAMLRGWQLAHTQPCAPVYVCLDSTLQEGELAEAPELPDHARFLAPTATVPAAASLDAAAGALSRSKRPVILFGRCRRTQHDWDIRTRLAERLGAAMLSDLKAGCMVSSVHPLHAGQPFNQPGEESKRALREADVILSLDWIDVGGLFIQALGRGAPVEATVIHAGQDAILHRGWGKEYCALPPVDINLAGDPDAAAAALLERLDGDDDRTSWFKPDVRSGKEEAISDQLVMSDIARALGSALGERPATWASLPRGWDIAAAPHGEPLAFLGKDGGAGLGSGPGLTIGAALALKDTGRLTIGVLGDGDTMMSINALWTAARYQIPALFVVANNRTYLNDETHQEQVAKRRSRNPANRWIGQSIDHPAPDFAALARAQGLEAEGPVTTKEALAGAVTRAVAAVSAGNPYLVDVHIGLPR